MKNFALILVVASLVGCATTPPKASVMVNNDAPIVISSNSSEALKELDALNIKGVRDLTLREFNQNKKDADLFEKSTGSKEGFNRLAYEAGGVGLGLAAGLSLGTVLGYGALTALTADDRPNNYSFAWDFDGRIKVISTSGFVNSEKLNSAIISVVNRLPELYPEVFTENTKVRFQQNESGLSTGYERNEYNSKKKIKLVLEPVTYLSSVSYVKTHSVPARSFCSDSLKECEVSINFFDLSKGGRDAVRLAQSNLLLRLIAAELDEDHLLYLPPNKPLYRLPMVIRGGTGEIEYLVEKTNP